MTTTTLDIENIPTELRGLPQWVVWKEERRDGKSTKVLYDARTGRRASSTDSETWTSFDDAYRVCETDSRYGGIGFVFSPDDPYAGVDLDGTLDQSDWITRFDSYTERSPSGEGIHIIIRGRMPNGEGRKRGDYEAYSEARFFTFTGQHIKKTPAIINERQVVLELYIKTVFPDRARRQSPRQQTKRAPVSDSEILKRARDAGNGAKFQQLWNGDLSGHENDHSRADEALCSLIAFWTGPDHNRIEQLFYQSKLADRDKWQTRQDYRDRTIAAAIDSRTEYYEWGDGTTFSFNGAAEPEPLERLNAGDQDLPRITGQSWNVLLKANEPARMFRFGSQLTRMERDEYGKPVLKPLDENRTRHELARAADWYKTVKRDHDWVKIPAMPAVAIVRDVLALPDPPLPILQTITEIPTFDPDGRLSKEPGYHPASKTFYAPAHGFSVPDVPGKPTPDDLKRAHQVIFDELLVDFPFTGKPEIAHAVGLLLLPCVRNMITGPTPLHLIEKPSPGTGASLLVDTLSTVASGRPAAVMTEGRDEDEWRKRITATLRSSPQFIHIDNLRERLDSAALSAVLTAEYWTDRMLGKSENVTLPIRAAWIATGNNPAMSTETARRTIRIRMDARVDEPWNRTTFKHPKLREWALQHRAEIVWSSLVMVQHWVAEGQPAAGQSLGSYEDWASVIGGILQSNNIEGFLGNLDEFYASADQESEQIRSFLRAWHNEYGSRPVTISKDLYRLVTGDALIDIEAKSVQGEKTKLGNLITSLRDRMYRLDESLTVRIEAAGEYRRAKQWRLRDVDEPDF